MRATQRMMRNRGKSNRRGNQPASTNRVVDSNGPEGKVRGTAVQLVEKYQTLCRDAATAGDRIASENFLQHAEHYLRWVASVSAERAAASSRESGNEVSDSSDKGVADDNASAKQQAAHSDGDTFKVETGAPANKKGRGGRGGRGKMRNDSVQAVGMDGNG